MSAKLTMADLSSNNGPANLHEHYLAGHRLLLLKATEGTSYSWSQAAADAKVWHAYGGICGHYAFLRPGDGTAQADKFLLTINRYVGPHDFLVADVEVGGVTAREVAEFIDRCHDRLPHLRGLVYGTAYFLRDNNIRPRHGWGLHLAAYPHIDFLPGGWDSWVAHQYTQTGAARGISGHVDLSHVKRELCQPLLHRGDANFAVHDLKVGLHKAGFGRFLDLTSDHYGLGTARAVKAFKHQHGLGRGQQHPGNSVGRLTWERLDHYLSY